MIDYFLILTLAHLLTDFVFQTETLVEYKQGFNVQKRNEALFKQIFLLKYLWFPLK